MTGQPPQRHGASSTKGSGLAVTAPRHWGQHREEKWEPSSVGSLQRRHEYEKDLWGDK